MFNYFLTIVAALVAYKITDAVQTVYLSRDECASDLAEKSLEEMRIVHNIGEDPVFVRGDA